MLRYIFRGHGEAGFLAHGCGLGASSAGRLAAAPGNAPPAEGGYLCLVPLRDAWRAVPSLAGRDGGRHFAAALEPAVMDDLRAGRCLLVLDLSNEGPEYNAEIFAALHRFAAEARVAPGRLVWLDQNRATPGTYADVTGARGAEALGFEHYDFFLKVTAWMFSPLAPHPVLGGREAGHAAAMFEPAGKDRLLLCLNATPRLHRVVTLGGLIEAGLFERSLVSFPGLDLAKDGDVGSADRVRAYLAANPALAGLAGGCERAIGLRGLRVDDFAETGNALFDRIDPRPYRRSFFSLVTETEFTTGTVDRVTEKIAKAFCLGHPTMVVGNPRALRFMRELGFDDFSGVIDQGYDLDPSPARRLLRILGQARGLAEAIGADPAGWLARARAAGEANIRLAASGGMLERYVALHEHPLLDRLERRLSGG